MSNSYSTTQVSGSKAAEIKSNMLYLQCHPGTKTLYVKQKKKQTTEPPDPDIPAFALMMCTKEIIILQDLLCTKPNRISPYAPG